MRLHLVIAALALSALTAAPARGQDQVTICHATGDPNSPYVPLTLDNTGVLEHINHDDDLVPAPAGGCPSAEVVLPEDTPVPTPTPAYTVPTPAPTATPTATPRPHRDDEDGQAGADDDGGGVRGSGDDGSPGPAGAPAATRAADTRDLPMTGAELWLIAGLGIGFLLSGTGIRLLSP